jgi:hypothetical protein
MSLWKFCCTSLIFATITACSGDSTEPAVTGVRAKITGVQTSGGVTASVRSGALPTGTGPSVTVPSSLSIINGGTSALSLTSTTAYTRVAIGVDGQNDYYELTVPTGTTSLQVLVTLAQDLTESTLPLAIAVGDASSNYGAPRRVSAALTRVGSGDVQIALSWDTPSDVDLHVIDPSNEEIYYDDETSTSGGSLDLDSNAGCTIDNKNNENITWPTGRSPSGTYKVLVDYWSSCGVPATNYVVTVTVAGRTPQVFTGRLTGGGTRGGAGAGTLITSFTR